MKKRKIVANSEIMDYVADMNVLLSWLNLEDKWQDDKSKIAYAGMLALKSAYKRVKAKYPNKSQVIIEQLKRLSQLENDHCDSIDEAAEPFAKLMEEVIQHDKIDWDNGSKMVIPWIGYHVGKWIYTIDALDDLEKDIQNRAYNPFIHQYKYQGEDKTEFRDKMLKDAEFNLISTLSEIGRSFELLNFKQNKDIIGNIIYLGMQKKTETILGRGKCFERSIRSAGNQ
jgi:hypothetical protein